LSGIAVKKITVTSSLLLLSISFISCRSSEFCLNKAEQHFRRKSSNKSITYRIYHDKKAIKRRKKNGVYFIKVTGYGLCSGDSSYLKKGATILAEKLTKIMNFKTSYRYIDIAYENISYGGPITHWANSLFA
jgi:hypothetical protein